MDYKKLLVISIGTGSNKIEYKYNAKVASKWGVFSWLYKHGSCPLVDIYSQSSNDMVDYHNSGFFQALQSQDRYLRIDDDTLVGKVASMDISTKKNMEDLKQVELSLLEKPVSQMNLDTGLYQTIDNVVSNAKALHQFAEQLSDERSSDMPREISALPKNLKTNRNFTLSFV